MALLLITSIVVSLAFGAERVPVGEVWGAVQGRLYGEPLTSSYAIIVWDLRLPRALLAVTVVAGLAISGVSMQTPVRTPLADPYLLGVSKGASAGAAAVLTIGALAGELTPIRLVLSGVVLFAGFDPQAIIDATGPHRRVGTRHHLLRRLSPMRLRF